jgi:FlaA1/EpsC-like NDP-sugar epimerase
MTISEAVELVLKAGSLATETGLFVLDMGKPVSILRLARQVIEASGHTVCDKTNPMGEIEIQFTGLRPGEKLVEQLTEGNELKATRFGKILTEEQVFPSEIEIALVLRDLRRMVGEGHPEQASQTLFRLVRKAPETATELA